MWKCKDKMAILDYQIINDITQFAKLMILTSIFTLPI